MLRMIAGHLGRNAVGYVALTVALGGTSYAAVELPKNSVGTKQLQANAVVSTKVKNGSLLKKDFKAGQLPRGATGPTGAAATKLWAVVNSDGTLARGSGVTSSSKVSTGSYNVLFEQAVDACAFLATTGQAASGTAPGDADVALLLGNPKGIYLETRNNTGTLADLSSHLAVLC